MEERQATRCQRCGEFIVFVRTERGKQMPCDQRQRAFIKDPNGKTMIMTRAGKLIRCYLTDDVESATGFGYLPHFASCSESRRQRTEKGTKTAPAKAEPLPGGKEKGNEAEAAAEGSAFEYPAPKEEQPEQMELFTVYDPNEFFYQYYKRRTRKK